MNFFRFQRFILASSGHARRFCSHEAEVDVHEVKRKALREFYMKFFGKSSTQISAMIASHPSLVAGILKYEDIEATAELLRQQNFSTAEIFQKPKCLLINKITLMNRIKVLNECCFINFRLLYLYRFVAIMNKNINLLKAYNYVDREANVAENLLKILDIPVTITSKIDEDVVLSETRETIMNFYLKAKLEMTKEDIEKLWKTYGSRLKNRNLGSIVEIINVLETKLKFSKQRIYKNGFLLYACPDNLNNMLDQIPSVANVPMKEIIYQRPKIAMQSVQTIKAIIGHVKSFDIPEDRILKCYEVLSNSADTVKERLTELSKVKEFDVLISNPRVLRLIHFQNKAKTRLDYLKQLKLNCVSLHVLTGGSNAFERYAREGVDKTKGKDTVTFLSKTFKMDMDEVRNLLIRHPHSYHIPIVSIQATIDYLRSKKFTDEEITQNFYLLLYPVSRIDQKLSPLLEWKEEDDGKMISGVSLAEISNSTLLNLCLYYIEAEFHFTGDGVWELTRPTNKQDEIFQTTIPEFPKTLVKQNKYGVNKKPKNVEIQ